MEKVANSALSVDAQQHKSVHISVISRARAKKIQGLNHLPTCVPTSEKTISCYCPFKGGAVGPCAHLYVLSGHSTFYKQMDCKLFRMCSLCIHSFLHIGELKRGGVKTPVLAMVTLNVKRPHRKLTSSPPVSIPYTVFATSLI